MFCLLLFMLHLAELCLSTRDHEPASNHLREATPQASLLMCEEEIVEAIRAENQGTLLQTLPASRSTALKTEVKNSHIKNVKRREEAEVSPAVAQEEAVDMLCSGLRTDVETTHLQNPLCSDDPSCASSEASNPCERRYRIHLGSTCESLARVSPNLHHQAEGMNDKHVSGNLCTPSRAACKDREGFDIVIGEDDGQDRQDR
ncbi:hypothetical protein COOONC_27275 [Cooperia oncophora]